jgi:hypothetical protein
MQSNLLIKVIVMAFWFGFCPSTAQGNSELGVFEDLIPDRMQSATKTVWSFLRSEAEVKPSGIVRVWIKADHSRDKTVKACSSRAFYEVDCKNKKTRTLANIMYASDDRVLINETFNESYTPFEFIVPGSMVDELRHRVCETK